jgi:hypothetical protein
VGLKRFSPPGTPPRYMDSSLQMTFIRTRSQWAISRILQGCSTIRSILRQREGPTISPVASTAELASTTITYKLGILSRRLLINTLRITQHCLLCQELDRRHEWGFVLVTVLAVIGHSSPASTTPSRVKVASGMSSHIYSFYTMFTGIV